MKNPTFQEYRTIALVGAGGKTSLMYALAHDMRARGKRVLCTSTTRIWPVSENEYMPAYLEDTLDMQALANIIEQRLDHHPLLLLARKQDMATGKWLGFDAASMTKLMTILPSDMHILIEADGAAMRPLKAPAAHEPVLPDNIDACLGVMGLDALGLPLAEPYVHRPDNIAICTGQALQSPITLDTYLRLAVHPAGLFQYCPHQMPKLVFFNKTDTLTSYIYEALHQTLINISQHTQGIYWYWGSALQKNYEALGDVSKFDLLSEK